MLAKRNWFATSGRFPWPVHWKAWAYFAAVGALLAVPWAILVARHHFPESLIWPWAVAALAVWDLRSMWRTEIPTATVVAPSSPTPVPRPEIEFIETPNYVVRRR